MHDFVLAGIALLCCRANALAAQAVAPATAGVTSFKPANGSLIMVGGSQYTLETAGQPWSVANPDPHTLRFEVRHDDFSAIDHGGIKNRSEIDGYRNLIRADQVVDVSYEFMLENGQPNSAPWFVLGQFHDKDLGVSPPFAVGLAGEHMTISISWLARQTSTAKRTGTQTAPGVGQIIYGLVYSDPLPIQRGHYYKMHIQAKFDGVHGFLDIWRDGAQIVDYQGPLSPGVGVYWKAGAYRSNAAEPQAVDYKDMQLKIGQSSAGL